MSSDDAERIHTLAKGDALLGTTFSLPSVAGKVFLLFREAVPSLRQMHGNPVWLCPGCTHRYDFYFRKHLCFSCIDSFHVFGRLLAVEIQNYVQQLAQIIDRLGIWLWYVFTDSHGNYEARISFLTAEKRGRIAAPFSFCMINPCICRF